jgi:hypothetical protein
MQSLQLQTITRFCSIPIPQDEHECHSSIAFNEQSKITSDKRADHRAVNQLQRLL